MYVVGFALMMVYSVRYSGRQRVSKHTAVWFTLLTYVFGVSGALLMGRIYTAVAANVPGESASTVAIFGAVILCPAALLLVFLLQNLFTGKKNDFRRQMDLLTHLRKVRLFARGLLLRRRVGTRYL